MLQVRPDQPPSIGAATATRLIWPGAEPTIRYRALDDYALDRVVAHVSVQRLMDSEQPGDGRVVEVAWFREPVVSVVRRPGWEMVTITWVLALATTYFGIDTDLNGDLAGAAARALLAGYGGADGG